MLYSDIIATVEHSFDHITSEIEGLGFSILAGISIIIVSGLVVFGCAVAWDVLSRMFEWGIYDPKNVDTGDWDDHPLNKD